jgi:YbbR-like protein
MTKRAGRWGLRLLAVTIAIVVWWLASVEKRERVSERVVDASVSFNSPPGLILLDPIQTVKVRLRGPDRRVRAVSPYEIDVLVDIKTDIPGTALVLLNASNVVAPEDIEVTSIEPNSLAIRVDRESTVELPILPQIVGEPAGGAVPDQPRMVPDRARVRGPQTIVSTLSSVSTSPISLDGHALSFSQTVSVVASDPLVHVVEPRFVTVQVPMKSPEIVDPENNSTHDGRH